MMILSRLVISCQKTYILKCSNCALYIQFSAPVYRESVKEVWVIPPVITNTVEISEKKRYSSGKKGYLEVSTKTPKEGARAPSGRLKLNHTRRMYWEVGVSD
jgi:hypothetical protein